MRDKPRSTNLDIDDGVWQLHACSYYCNLLLLQRENKISARATERGPDDKLADEKLYLCYCENIHLNI